jgi:YEATS domain-containing protein 4
MVRSLFGWEKKLMILQLISGLVSFLRRTFLFDRFTHLFSVFLRGPNDEDLSVFISKVIFSLHPSFAIPIRGSLDLFFSFSISPSCWIELAAPPYEVTEMGWGEFEAGIRIYFKDPEEKVQFIPLCLCLFIWMTLLLVC